MPREELQKMTKAELKKSFLKKMKEWTSDWKGALNKRGRGAVDLDDFDQTDVLEAEENKKRFREETEETVNQVKGQIEALEKQRETFRKGQQERLELLKAFQKKVQNRYFDEEDPENGLKTVNDDLSAVRKLMRGDEEAFYQYVGRIVEKEALGHVRGHIGHYLNGTDYKGAVEFTTDVLEAQQPFPWA